MNLDLRFVFRASLGDHSVRLDSGTAQNAWPDNLPGAQRRKIAVSAALDNMSTLMNPPSASRVAAALWPSRLG